MIPETAPPPPQSSSADTAPVQQQHLGGADSAAPLKRSAREESDGRADAAEEVAAEGGGGAEESGREILKRHRLEVGGRVWVPEKWGQEGLLKDWIDGSVFDRPLVASGLVSARAALVGDQCRRPAD